MWKILMCNPNALTLRRPNPLLSLTFGRDPQWESRPKSCHVLADR